MNYFAIAAEMTRRAAAKRIELVPCPPEKFYDPATGVRSQAEYLGPYFSVYLDTPRGHYVVLDDDSTCIVVVDDFRAGSGVYGDLIPGFRLEAITALPVIDAHGKPETDDSLRSDHFVRIDYRRETDA